MDAIREAICKPSNWVFALLAVALVVLAIVFRVEIADLMFALWSRLFTVVAALPEWLLRHI